jgi:hypothetical protein
MRETVLVLLRPALRRIRRLTPGPGQSAGFPTAFSIQVSWPSSVSRTYYYVYVTRNLHFEVEGLDSLNPVCTVSVIVQEKADIYLYFCFVG